MAAVLLLQRDRRKNMGAKWVLLLLKPVNKYKSACGAAGVSTAVSGSYV